MRNLTPRFRHGDQDALSRHNYIIRIFFMIFMINFWTLSTTLKRNLESGLCITLATARAWEHARSLVTLNRFQTCPFDNISFHSIIYLFFIFNFQLQLFLFLFIDYSFFSCSFFSASSIRWQLQLEPKILKVVKQMQFIGISRGGNCCHVMGISASPPPSPRSRHEAVIILVTITRHYKWTSYWMRPWPLNMCPVTPALHDPALYFWWRRASYISQLLG